MQTLRQLFLLIPILRRFGIIRWNRQAALHSALFNYAPLVIGGTDKNKQLAIIKPTQTGINRNKWTFCNIKSSEPPKNSKPAASLSKAKFYKFLSKFLKSISWDSPFKLTQKMRPRLKISTHLGSFYSLRSIPLNHFQADLIWCDGTFQEIPITTAASKNVNVSIGGENFNKMHIRNVLW
jgi:hypothetical protein